MADDISEKQNEAAAIIDAPMNEGEPVDSGFSSENAWNIHKTVHHQEQPKLRYDEPLAERKRAIDEREKAAKHRREIIRRNPAPGSSVDQNAQNQPVDMLSIIEGDDEAPSETTEPITPATADAAVQRFHEKQESFRNPYEKKSNFGVAPAPSSETRTPAQIERDKRRQRLGVIGRRAD